MLFTIRNLVFDGITKGSRITVIILSFVFTTNWLNNVEKSSMTSSFKVTIELVSKSKNINIGMWVMIVTLKSLHL